jgi:hypothetical protein
MSRFASFLPRLVVLTVIWLLATATLTLAAGKRMATATVKPLKPRVAPTTPAAVLVVPDVRRQAYTFAKGILSDGGFAWKVSAGSPGFAANTVATQTPAPGTRVVDTGEPTIILRLQRGGAQLGAPESSSPYDGTPIRLADVASAPVVRKPVVKPVATPVAKAKPTAKLAPKSRPPAFTVAGAKPEPLDEMPLPDRARMLDRWLATHRAPTNENVGYWLYQHSWIVTGAQFGWWHGAEALRLLVQADRRAQSLWGIGTRSEAVAHAALAEVEASAQ